MKNNYLFVIGINEYKYCPSLFSPIKSVQDLIQILSSKYGFESTNILSLTNVEATKDDIIKSFDKISNLLTDRDNLIIFFSGHSYIDRVMSEGFWIPYDGQYDDLDSMIPNELIFRKLASINAKHIFTISDAIFSGKYINKYENKSEDENGKSRWILSAGINEIVSDGAPGRNSPFFETIAGKLYNAQESLSVSDLIDYVVDSVPIFASQPAFGGRMIRFDKGGNYVLNLKKTKNSELLNELKKMKLEIAKGNTEAVLEDLIETNNSFLDYVILLNNRWRNLKKEVLGGTIDKKIADIESNQITKSLIELINEIEKEEKNAS